MYKHRTSRLATKILNSILTITASRSLAQSIFNIGRSFPNRSQRYKKPSRTSAPSRIWTVTPFRRQNRRYWANPKQECQMSRPLWKSLEGHLFRQRTSAGAHIRMRIQYWLRRRRRKTHGMFFQKSSRTPKRSVWRTHSIASQPKLIIRRVQTIGTGRRGLSSFLSPSWRHLWSERSRIHL